MFFSLFKVKNEQSNQKARCKPVHEIIKMRTVTENVDMQRGLKVQPKPKCNKSTEDKGVNMDLHECKQQRTRPNAWRWCQMFRFCRGQVELKMQKKSGLEGIKSQN